ncbi:LytTR family DNA-binding domain-containing protein [Streptococcus acidominimus]|uniref:LytTR family transcriptional regulator n=1 Tax=Streptococcus acidominimus TaxID=1326 RepID=A0A4Y9FR02_STRAI|nr:LytTR family transcriptional regulator DNA-binding domain-containing protein [Streptococcus acidominimus]MBF0818148.1 LytTR family transcriptional regulator DNA-binding domain-containing protein [Streptococcus acidominimus]MBF0840031.1 LytTR family transcriptional regulator DNA-binding domain-containing protein [Streptococcus acidominimus]MBF0847348.1 LytTR family transcriptional regulator DNA-binding domain-containing protein [Streptococcus danieliae]TFU31665.1 LytTR family transcriptional 
MDVRVAINPAFAEDQIQIEARSMTQEISDLVAYAKQLDRHPTNLTVRRGEEVYLLEWRTITRLYLENRVLQVKANNTCYQSSLRLYQVKEMLPEYFLQIPQSEIINLKQLDHLQLTPNGLVKLVLDNNDVTYSSRRYLKTIKEALHL